VVYSVGHGDRRMARPAQSRTSYLGVYQSYILNNMSNQSVNKAILAIILVSAVALGNARANECGSLHNHYGPFDYTSNVHFTKMLPVVEKHHFTPKVEKLLGGESSSIIGDIDYTLRAFPNHHRALYSLVQYTFKMEGKKAEYRAAGQHIYSTECYFDRAIRFKPRDGNVRYLFALYLHKKGKHKESLTHYKTALKISPKSYEIHYNLGLLYMDMKNMAEAKKHAKIAYSGRYPLPGLREKLKKAGFWD